MNPIQKRQKCAKFPFEISVVRLSKFTTVIFIITILINPVPNALSQVNIMLDSSSGNGFVSFQDANNSDPHLPASLPSLNGLTDTFYDINIELLYGTTPNNVNIPVVTLLRSSNNHGNGSTAIGQVLSAEGDITALADGSIIDYSGSDFLLPNVNPGGSAYFRILAWTGDFNNYQSACSWFYSDPQLGGYWFVVYTGQSTIFSEQFSSGPVPIPSTINNMPNLVLGPQTLDAYATLETIPEPSTILMAVTGCLFTFLSLFLNLPRKIKGNYKRI